MGGAVTTYALPPHANAAASATLTRAALIVAPALDAAVGRLSPSLQDPVHHHLAGGGKRVRAALSLLSAAAAGATEDTGVVGAVAIELIHNFSLIHDDIIDGDTERRHRSTVWSEFGIGQAIIAGDALATLALQVMLEHPTAERVRAAGCLLDATQVMIAGQGDDMEFEARPSVTVAECLDMERGKTSALLACAVSLGAILAGAPDATVAALAEFGSHVGTAFQAVDDLLGIWGEPARTGKPVGSDLVQHKKTLPISIALARGDKNVPELRRLLAGDLSPADVERAGTLIEDCGARDATAALADEYLDLALAALDRVSLVPGPKSDLVAIARFVTERDR
jgi:geranylgeranyl diphosphate synthase, type I